MSKFCQDLKCDFYNDDDTSYPDGCPLKFKVCPYCTNPLTDVRPNTVVTDEILQKCDSPKPQPGPAPLCPTNNVVVTFYTAILLTHYKPASSVIL